MSDVQTIYFMGEEIKVLDEEMETLRGAMSVLEAEKYDIEKEEEEIKKLEKLIAYIKKELQELQVFILRNMANMRKDPKIVEQIVEHYIKIWGAYMKLNDIFGKYHQTFENKAKQQLKERPLYVSLQREYTTVRNLIDGINQGLFGGHGHYAELKKEDLINKFRQTQGIR